MFLYRSIKKQVEKVDSGIFKISEIEKKTKS